MPHAIATRFARATLVIAASGGLASPVIAQIQVQGRAAYTARDGGWTVELNGDFMAIDRQVVEQVAPDILDAVRRDLEHAYGEGSRVAHQALREMRLRYASVRQGQSVMLLPYPFDSGPAAPWGQILELPAGVRRREIEDDRVAQRIWQGISERFPRDPYRARRLDSVERRELGGVRYLSGRGTLSGAGVPTLQVEYAVVPLGGRALLIQFCCGAEFGAGFWPKAQQIIASLDGAAETTDRTSPSVKVGFVFGLGAAITGLILVHRRRRRHQRCELAQLADAQPVRRARRADGARSGAGNSARHGAGNSARRQGSRGSPVRSSAPAPVLTGAPASPQSVPEEQQRRDARAEAELAASGAGEAAPH
jgi:hypothetical protein